MKNWTETKSTLKEARGLLKKGLGRYIIFSLPIALLSIGFGYIQKTFLGALHLSLSILLIIVFFIAMIILRIWLIHCIEAIHRGERCAFIEIVHRFKTNWKRVSWAYILYGIILLAACLFTAPMVIPVSMITSPIIGQIIIYACVIWVGIRLFFMRYIAILDTSKSLVDSAFRLTKGHFWTILRININTYSGWILLFAAIRYAASTLGYTSVSPALDIIWPLSFVIIEPYRIIAEVILYRRYQGKIDAQESAEFAGTDAGKPNIHTHPTETPFIYCESDKEGKRQIEGILDAWLAHYPSARKSEPQRGIQSESAFYALFVHELLIKMDCSIKTQTNDRKFFITEMDRISLVLAAINIAREAMQGRNPVRTIRNILNQSRHGYAGQPYVITLNCPDFTTHRHDADILFGDNTGSGFWSPSKNTRVSAVLISSIHPESLLYPSIIVRLYLNPWARYPYDGVLTQLDTYRVDGQGPLQCIKGRNILDILGIDNSAYRD